MSATTQTTHAALSAEKIEGFTHEQRQAELKTRLGAAYASSYGENRATLPEIIILLQDFILSTPIPKEGSSAPSPAAAPAASNTPAPASVATPAPAPKAATPPALNVTGVDRTILFLARKRAQTAK